MVYENLGGKFFGAQHVAKSDRLVWDCLFELIVMFGFVFNIFEKRFLKKYLIFLFAITPFISVFVYLLAMYSHERRR